MRHYASAIVLCSSFGCMAPDGCTGAVADPYPVSGPVLEQGVQTYVGAAGLLGMAENVKSSLLGDQVELCLPATATTCHRDERCADDSLGCRVLLTIGDVDLVAVDQGDPDGLRFTATIDAVDISGLTGTAVP